MVTQKSLGKEPCEKWKGIKLDCTGNTGTYDNEHSNDFLSVYSFKQIVKNLKHT